jgi:hypothetical protein
MCSELQFVGCRTVKGQIQNTIVFTSSTGIALYVVVKGERSQLGENVYFLFLLGGGGGDEDNKRGTPPQGADSLPPFH